MAIQNKTEDGNSYQTHNIQLTREIATRAGNTPTKDEDFINCIFEIIKEKAARDQRDFILKRCGTAELAESEIASEIRGMYFWEDEGKLFYAASDHLYVYNYGTATVSDLGVVFANTSGEVGFTEYLFDTNVVTLVASDGVNIYQVDTANAVTTCADADLPTPHIPSPVFIDGYLLLVKTDTADVYNSDLNDPFAWTTGNFIAAEMQPDYVVKIAKVNNYLVVFGTSSVEYFWDAANASGSPFSRNDSPIKINTYLGGLSQFGNDIFYVGKSGGGQPSMFMLKDFKLEDVGTPSIARYLNFVTANTSTWKTSVVSVQGHTILVMAVGTKTFVYDVENKLWGRWAYQATDLFDIIYAVRATTATTRQTVFALRGASSALYYFSDGLMQDSAVNYTYQIITEQSNFGTLNRKTMARFSLYADRTPSDSNLNVYWTDDDFQTYHGPKAINMNQDLQSTYILGSFRQRAFKLVYTGQYLLRLQSIEVDINKGIS